MEVKSKYKINYFNLRKVIRNQNISRSARLLLLNLLLYAGLDGVSYPSQTKLADDLGVTSRQISNLLTELSKHKLIKWSLGSFPATNNYTFSSEIYCRTDIQDTKGSSPTTGNNIHVTTGNEFPTNVVTQSNQQHSQLLQLFEKSNKSPISDFEKRKFFILCNIFSVELIEEAINLSIKRGKPSFNTSYLSAILTDWKQNGKPPSRPKFMPCGQNGCEGGYIAGEKKYIECKCRAKYEAELVAWKREWGGRR